jgi:hypothetical protein
MPDILEDIAYLSQEIGARPAGTEEEQQAALYIADQFKKRVGIPAQIEDFSCNAKHELMHAILFGVPIAFSILAMVLSMFVVPTILISLACAVLFVLEVTNRPVVSRLFQRGVSQNVVAKYHPEGKRSGRSRKIILVANYDSGKVQQELTLGGGLAVVQKISAVALVILPIAWLVRSMFAMGATGGTLVAWNVVMAILMLLAAVPVILFVMHNAAQYNEAANCNASGVAALLEVADRINNTVIDFESEVEVHGEGAAREAGLVPEGAEIEYVATAGEPVDDEQTEEERLMAAKAAVAALTGKPLREYAPAPKEEDAQPEAEGVPFDGDELAEGESMPAAADVSEGEPAPIQGQVEVGEESVAAPGGEAPPVPQPATPTAEPAIPDWYRKAQEKADKSHQEEAPARRSRYASALDEAVAASSAFFNEANRVVADEESMIEETFNSGIKEVASPDAGAAGTHRGQQQGAYVADESLPSTGQPQDTVEEGSIAAAFMVPQPQQEAVDDGGEQTAPIPAVESVMQEDEYAPGATTAMQPIDVSAIRDAYAHGDTVRELQSRPSREVEPAQRRNVERIVYSETDDARSVTAQRAATPRDTDDALSLPELDSDLPSLSDLRKQRAPLAEEGNPSLSSQIPRINLDAFGVSTSGNAEPLDNKRAALRSMLPSMSGSISLESDAQQEETGGTVSLTGSFAPISATGSASRVGDELVEGVDPEELYIDDADDSFSETTMTETGAYAGPGYVDMPESRMSRFFGRFHKKNAKKDDSRSAQEWLDVNDDFNPTEVGAERGGWDSFADNDRGRLRSNRRDADDFLDEEDWNGGAYSGNRAKASAQGVDGAYVDAPDSAATDLDQIESFYARRMELDVWFVALGSEHAGNGGMRAFLSEHAPDLRGAVFINLDSLGAGDFCYLEREGFLLEKSPSSRLRRYVKKAQQACGVPVGSGAVHWRDSAATIAMKRGYQALTLAGMDGSKPAMMGQGDDVVESIDANALYDRVDYVEAMVRSI